MPNHFQFFKTFKKNKQDVDDNNDSDASLEEDENMSSPLELSEEILDFIEQYKNYQNEQISKDETPKIQVDEIASKIATFYEKIRSLIDYQESHILRKNVIERALKRRIFLKDISGSEIAEPLIREIIRSGYISNNAVPENKISEVQQIIDNTIAALEHFEKSKVRNTEKLKKWLLGIAVCAIEETLDPPGENIIFTSFVWQQLHKHLIVNGSALSNFDKDVLLYVALEKAFFRLDRDRLNYEVLKFIYPAKNLTRQKNTEEFLKEILTIKESIAHFIEHPHLPFFIKLCHHYNIVFLIISDLVFNKKSINSQNIDTEVELAYEARYIKEKGRLARLAFFSVISFFLSKILVALLFEIPIDLYLTHNFSLRHSMANIAFPPLLMALIVLSIKLPSRKNLILITDTIKAMVFKNYEESYNVNIPKESKGIMKSFVRLAYVAVFIVSLYYISKFLLWLGFSIANIAVFALFTSLIAATGVKIYNRTKTLSLEKERIRFLNFLLDLFTVPLITIGKWLISGLRHFNILVLFVNFFIELPFQLFIEFLENFNSFVKRKKEEIE